MPRKIIRTSHVATVLDMSEADISGWLSLNPEYKPLRSDASGYIWKGREVERFKNAYDETMASKSDESQVPSLRNQ